MEEKLRSKEQKEKHPIYKKAKELREKHPDTHDLVIAVGNFIGDHIGKFKKPYDTKNILESRFTPPEEAFDKGMSSCGAVVNISSAMFRHVGVEVRLIHGTHEKSRNHAWISVFEPEKDEWVPYDLTRGKEKGYKPTKDQKVIAICNEWEEIRDVIEKEHNDWLESKKRVKRG